MLPFGFHFVVLKIVITSVLMLFFLLSALGSTSQFCSLVLVYTLFFTRCLCFCLSDLGKVPR